MPQKEKLKELTIPEENAFEWIPLYRAVAKKVLEYKDSRKALVRLLLGVHQEAGRTSDFLYSKTEDGEKHLKENIDPFTVMNGFNMALSPKSMERLQRAYAESLGIEYTTGRNDFLVPVGNNLNISFLDQKDNDPEKINDLWALFEAALKDPKSDLFIERLNKVLSLFGGKIVSISIILYIVSSDTYISLDKNTVDLIELMMDKKIDVKKLSAEDYLELLTELENHYSDNESHFKNNRSVVLGSYINKEKIKKLKDLPNEEQKDYWLYTPGENASMWNQFYNDGIIALGWNKLGNLNQYKNKEKIANKLKELSDEDNQYINDSLANWQFANDMKKGDVVYAKKGKMKIVGRGIVQSDYFYDRNEKNYSHKRKVNWDRIPEFDFSLPIVKTLTKITDKTELIEKIEDFIKSSYDHNCWLLIANPSIWSFSEIEAGETQFYSIKNSRGNKRRIALNYENAEKGDRAIGYEATPMKAVVAELEIVDKDDDSLYFKKIRDLPVQLDFEALKNDEMLSSMEFFEKKMGSLFKLTEEEYTHILDLSEETTIAPSTVNNENESYTDNDFLKEVFLNKEKLEKLKKLLGKKKNLILQGPPGVGKTFMAKKLAYAYLGEKAEDRVKMIQFHQNYTYEDFVIGFKPKGEGFSLERGVFHKYCQKARNNPDEQYFIIIDEINRGNISKIFGELLMLIESDKRGAEYNVELSYSHESFHVPENLYIIGLMNTADRSLAIIDYALRRRFVFYTVEPGFKTGSFKAYQKELGSACFNKLIDAVDRLNERVIKEDNTLGKDYQIGHSFFCNLDSEQLKDDSEREELEMIIESEIEPLLYEYWFDQEDKAAQEVRKLKQALED